MKPKTITIHLVDGTSFSVTQTKRNSYYNRLVKELRCAFVLAAIFYRDKACVRILFKPFENGERPKIQFLPSSVRSRVGCNSKKLVRNPIVITELPKKDTYAFIVTLVSNYYDLA